MPSHAKIAAMKKFNLDHAEDPIKDMLTIVRWRGASSLLGEAASPTEIISCPYLSAQLHAISEKNL
ncbi:hypothetical protein GCK32_019685 [Trichostrongylus colubriformis]|uniref:Uncharacterized protein n=1 Tax=Trichostrongylus colubriformis TaxID=6319 RepID=A0AAN8FKE4_TRICO